MPNSRAEGIKQRWLGFSERERVLLLAVLIVPVVMIAFSYFFEPMFKSLRGIDSKISSTQQLVDAQSELWKQISIKDLPNPNKVAQQEIERLEAELAEVDEALEQAYVHLVKPSEMVQLLHEVLGQEKGVRLVAVAKQPVEPISVQGDAPSTSDAEQPPSRVMLYRHPLQIELSGDYASLHRYLIAVESLHVGFFWELLTLKVVQHPEVEMSVLLYTISTEESWLGE